MEILRSTEVEQLSQKHDTPSLGLDNKRAIDSSHSDAVPVPIPIDAPPEYEKHRPQSGSVSNALKLLSLDFSKSLRVSTISAAFETPQVLENNNRQYNAVRESLGLPKTDYIRREQQSRLHHETNISEHPLEEATVLYET